MRQIQLFPLLCGILSLLSLVRGLLSYEFDKYNIKYYQSTLGRELSLGKSGKENVLLPFNTTRVPGSKESQTLQKFIRNFYQNVLNNYWELEQDQFEQNSFNFTNMVFTLNGDADKFIVLSAHYDSKIEPEGFIGGMDSAVPCAIMMYVSKFIDQIYTQDRLNMDSRVGLKIVFFDGEEAIKEWTRSDSLYGSRHLARKWRKNKTLKKINMLVLMDLIGGKGNHTIPSFYRAAHDQYKILNMIEDAYLNTTATPIFSRNINKHKELNVKFEDYLKMNQILIDDDHAPFFRQGVPTLHLITAPFPETWHTVRDNFANLDQDNINKWAVLMCEYISVSLSRSSL